MLDIVARFGLEYSPSVVRNHRKAGFGTIEIVISMTLVALMMAWGYSFVMRQTRTITSAATKMGTAIQIQQGMRRFFSDIQASGTNYTLDGTTSKTQDPTFSIGMMGQRFPYGIDPKNATGSGEIFYIYSCFKENSTDCSDWPNARSNEKLLYKLSEGKLLRIEKGSPSPGQAFILADDIETVQIEFFDPYQNSLGTRIVSSDAVPDDGTLPTPNFKTVGGAKLIASMIVTIVGKEGSVGKELRFTEKVRKMVSVPKDEV